MKGVPIFRVSVLNATLLSAIYLGGACVVEVARRYLNYRWADDAAYVLDAFPSRALDVAGVMPWVKHAFIEGTLSATQVRLIFGTTTVLVIFVLAAGVGVGLWAFGKAWDKVSAAPQG